MKINWGTGIAIFYISFVIAVLGFVFWTANLSPELVTDDYYGDELKYQQVIDSKNRANELIDIVRIELNQGTIRLKFPTDMEGKSINGELLMYRQDDKSLDRTFEVSGTKLIYNFEYDKLISGFWKAKLNWTAEGKDYYYEENILVE